MNNTKQNNNNTENFEQVLVLILEELRGIRSSLENTQQYTESRNQLHSLEKLYRQESQRI